MLLCTAFGSLRIGRRAAVAAKLTKRLPWQFAALFPNDSSLLELRIISTLERPKVGTSVVSTVPEFREQASSGCNLLFSRRDPPL